ncbi:MAG: hypothetical protein JRE23_18725, partial [Deltaproteobacteria bacterium]|nr:hypothetical protein [Deltaproteobacteria bacterium]
MLMVGGACVTTVRFGSTDSSWIPVVGDWNGSGTDTIGMYSRTQKSWYLKSANNDGWPNVTTVRFGSTDSSWFPVVGDWDGQSYVYTGQVHETIVLAAGEKSSTTAYCPSGSILISGGYATFEDVLVYTQRWMNGGWRGYAKNNASVSRAINVYATCLYNVPAYTRLVWSQVSVPAFDNGHPVVPCPIGSVITGGGWAGNSDGSLRIYNSSTSGNGWEVWAENTSGSSELLNAYAICLSGVGALSNEIMESVVISPGYLDSASPACGAGAFVTGGGFASQPD